MTEYALRYNDNKPRYDLIILSNIYDSFSKKTQLTSEQLLALEILRCISHFQTNLYDGSLVDAMSILTDYWDDCARVFEYGAKKYEDWNWLKGMKWSTNLASLTRHIMAILKDKDALIDSESGISHFGHILCNLVMFRYSITKYPENNDLPTF